jgi:hypothetical protein
MAWTVKVEVAFATAPMATTPTWTDISQYVRLDSIQITRGRPDEFSDVQPSTLSLGLKNGDGRFTMGKTGGAYYPNVKIGKRIRVSVSMVTSDASTFEGSAGGWAADTGAPTVARSTAQARTGVASLAVTSTAAGTFAALGPAFRVAPGQNCTASTWSRAATTGRVHECGINWYDAASVYISTDASAVDPTTTTTGWVTATASGNAPANAATGRVYGKWTGAAGAGEVQYLDDVEHPSLRRFDGHVNQWPTEWVAGRSTYAEAQLTATDRLKRFGQIGDLRSMLEEEVLRDTGTTGAYYPLSEPSEATTIASIGATPWGTGDTRQVGAGGTLEFASGTGPGTDGLAAPMFTRVDRDNGQYLVAYPISVGTSTAVTLECWIATTVSDAPICSLTSPGLGLTLFVLGGGNAGKLGVYFEDQSTLFGGGPTGGVYNDGRTHHLVATLSRSGTTVTADLYVDSVHSAGASGTFTYKVLPKFTRFDIGGSHVQHTVGVYSGTLSHVAAYSSVLSTTRITAHYNAGANGLTGERTDQRIGRIADYIAIPAADRAFDTGDGTVGPQATSGKQPVEAMREAEHTENGVLFLSGAGLLTFHKRSRRYNTTPAVTYNANQLAAWPVFPADDFGLTNDMTVSRPQGSPARSVNQASIDDFGLYRDEAEIIADSDTDTRAVAEWRVNTYGTPRVRVPNITVEVNKLERVGSSLVAGTLAAEIGTRIKVQSLATQAPASSVELFIEGWTERISKTVWFIEFNTSPADASAVWQLGVSGFSELGTTTRLAL